MPGWQNAFPGSRFRGFISVAPVSATSALFNEIVAVTFQMEGGGAISLLADDPGNWTGGAVGIGILRGTRWGISAAAFPQVDIAGMDEAHAAGIAWAHFWSPARCSWMPAPMAMVMFDAAFQHGGPRAVQMLQRALSVRDDGVFGNETWAAFDAAAKADGGPYALAIQFQSQRLLHMVEQEGWRNDAHGLARRLCTVLAKASQMESKPHE